MRALQCYLLLIDTLRHLAYQLQLDKQLAQNAVVDFSFGAATALVHPVDTQGIEYLPHLRIGLLSNLTGGCNHHFVGHPQVVDVCLG